MIDEIIQINAITAKVNQIRENFSYLLFYIETRGA